MGKRLAFVIPILVAWVLCSSAAFPQESTVKGSIAGVVVDSTGAVVQKAKLTLTGPTGKQTTESAADGAFSFPLLPPGSYGVKVEKQGFKADEVTSVEVATGRTTSLRLQLQVGAISETVEVTATAVTIDTTAIATGSNLNDAFYASVPVPRNVSGLFYIAPGVADSGGAGRSNPSISGGSGLENLYVADGVNITDAAYGGLGIFTRVYGSVGSGINLTFVKDVQVKTGSFGAEYGQSTGGVVQIVTKSGGQEYHGALGAYFAPVNAAAAPKQIDDLRNRKVGQDAFSANGPGSGLFAGPGGYDASGEFGGFIPGFKNNLFFFGSYSPALKTDFSSPPQFAGSQQFFASQGFTGTPPQVGLFTLQGGKPIYTRAWTNNYSGKLTWKLNSSHSLESSVFGDPTSTNTSAFRVVNAQNTSVFSKQEYSTRNWVVRYNGTLSPTWLVNASFSWNNNQFTETPLSPNVFNIVDQSTTGLSPTLQGLGFVENHNADNFSYAFDTSKSFHFLGSHTIMLGGSEGFLNYDDIKSRTGGGFAVPDLGTARNAAVYGCAAATGNPLCPLGFTTNASFRLKRASSTCTLCPFYKTLGGQTVRVFAQNNRGEYGPGVVSTDGLALAGFAQDTWTINKHLSLSAGLRWEQYRMRGVAEHYTFTDNWAPRLGVVYDPWGDRKTKVFLNWARYNYQMPLDAAIRSLSDELDISGLRFAPKADGSNNVIINSDGSINIVPDAAHLLNKTAGGINKTVFSSEQAGGNLEGFAPGTKMQYEDEYVVGFERELGHQMVVSARYLDRRLRRIVEDVGGVSPEAADFGFPFNQVFLITNPHKGLDLFKNEPIPTVQPFGALCPSGNVSDTDANNFPFATGLQACWGDLSQQIADCSTTPPSKNCPGSPNPDGVSDGFVDPVRNYQAVEFELNKGFSNNWLMRLNYRLAYLRGNYEGAFRNDNGQTDPSISSLFDFTTGVLNLLGDQFAVGPLNTDRHHTGNLFLSYTFDRSRFKGVTLGTGMRIQSGTPVSEFGNHPAYGNAGEVPIGGRGKEGRTPPTGAVDLHAEYAHKLSERVTVRAGADLFNIFDSRQLTLRDQLRDLSFQAPFSNTKTDITGAPGANDFLTPVGFQNPFYARFAVKLQF